MIQQRWQFFIDRGGTFTDIVAHSPEGRIIVHKLLSESSELYQDAPIQGIRDIMGLTSNIPIPAEQIEVVRMGTTVATNALLERKGDRLVLLITKGFADALRIGYQNRPDIFARQIILPTMLYEAVVEIDERYDAHGSELKPVNSHQVRQDLEKIYAQGIRGCAIALMHGYRYPQHELEVASIAHSIGFEQISVSHQVSPLQKLISRGDTTVVDAYLTPILRRYIDRIVTQLPNTKLMFMKSDGGLVAAEHFQGKDSILSGPAGGIVGAVKTSQLEGFSQIVTFDMGGTSTDVAHFAGEYERELDLEIAGVRMCVPVLAIHTIAAGGGSLLRFDGSSYRVGPESGGSNPGPACYRQGGDLTVTDANIILGKIQPQYFPAVFGSTGDLYLDTAIVHQKFRELAAEISQVTRNQLSLEQVASGFMTIAIANMANAIKKISLQRGYDITNYVLCCFGGAGGQVACQVAETLGIRKILIHQYAGVLSAYGMGLAELRTTKVSSLEISLSPQSIISVESQFDLLAQSAQQEFPPQASQKLSQKIIRKVNLKYAGTNATLEINFYRDIQRMQQEFEQQHQARYGFTQPGQNLIVASVSLELIQEVAQPSTQIAKGDHLRTETLEPVETISIYSKDQWHSAQVYFRHDLEPEDCITGPAVVVDQISTIVIEPEWQGKLSLQKGLILEHTN